MAAKRNSLPPIVRNEAMNECERKMLKRIVYAL
jgi:hypothetical protein